MDERDDSMLHEYRREPDPGFAKNLRERLRRQEEPRRLLSGNVARVLAAACAVVVVAALFAIPSVRVSAQALLDIFRVRRFAAVEFKESRFETLRSLGKDPGLLVLDKRETVLDPGDTRPVRSSDEASNIAGIDVSSPKYLPMGMTADTVFVEGAGEMRFSVSEAKLRSLLDRLDLQDVTVPQGLDGHWIDVRKPTVVIQTYRSKNRRLALVEAKSPEVSVPAGWNPAELAEIGLRVLGLDEGEARWIARSTDWRSTLLVPVPTDASTFRQVTVRGQPGLLITTKGEKGADGHQRDGVMLLWTERDRVFCLRGILSPGEVMQIAESLS
jgi:hypothetical protein